MAGSKFEQKRAVALFYEQEETPLPMVLAKGESYMAERMIATAEEEGIPIMENVPLASALYSEVDLNHYIPSELIEPVAEVLNWAQKLKEEGASY
ncbi:MAG: EscU/YscU/HrcU family type III secretion system export apparatus switch protein [Verrucomicrobiota bacterium]